MGLQNRNNKDFDYKVAVAHNNFFKAQYFIDAVPQKLMWYLISRIDSVKDKVLNSFSIHLSELNFFKGDVHTNYEKVLCALEKLKHVDIILEDIDNPNEYISTTFLKYRFNTLTNIVTVKIDDDLAPYFTNLSEGNFNKFYITNISNISKTHSIKMYGFISSKQIVKKEAETVISLSELKLMLGVSDKYPQYKDFKKQVLNKVYNDLKEHSDTYFEFKELRNGRKIDALILSIKSKKNDNIQKDNITNNDEKSITESYNLTFSSFRKILIKDYKNIILNEKFKLNGYDDIYKVYINDLDLLSAYHNDEVKHINKEDAELIWIELCKNQDEILQSKSSIYDYKDKKEADKYSLSLSQYKKIDDLDIKKFTKYLNDNFDKKHINSEFDICDDNGNPLFYTGAPFRIDVQNSKFEIINKNELNWQVVKILPIGYDGKYLLDFLYKNRFYILKGASL